MSSFLQFALYFFTCHIVYDIIYTTIRNMYIDRQLKKISLELEQKKLEGITWN